MRETLPQLINKQVDSPFLHRTPARTQITYRLITSRNVKHSPMTSKSTFNMNYVPLRSKRQSPLPSIDSETSDSYPSQPPSNAPVYGHSESSMQQSDACPPRIPHAFSTVASITTNVEKKLSALTLRLEKELSSEYYGQCHKCGQSMIGSSDACQAMGNLYHNRCFTCVLCDRMLRDKAFYCIHEQVYCEEDYWVRRYRSCHRFSHGFSWL